MSQASEAFEAAGRALHGEEWKEPLCRDLGIRRESLSGWLSGRRDPPPSIWIELLELVERRWQQAEGARIRLRALIARP